MKTETYELYDNKVEIPIAESYKDCLSLIKSDRYRISGKLESSLSIILHSLRHFNSSTLFWFRLCQYKGWCYPFLKFVYTRVKGRCQVEIPVSTKIGYGFRIVHGMCVVINGLTIIGNNVDVLQFLSIGTNYDTPAIIGDNVWIGPHVSIVENVKIGNNSSIGAGAVVIKDVPENATVAGVPAKTLNYNNPGRFINNRWQF